MERMTIGALLLSSALLAAAAPTPGASVWTVAAIDPKGDGREPSLADAAQLSYRYDESDDMLWFRVSLFDRPNAGAFGVNIAVDTGANGSGKANWWGANKEFAFDRLVTAWVNRTGDGYSGTIGISDATGANRHELTNLATNSVDVRVDGDAILVGVKRRQLTEEMTMKVVAAVGSNEAWNDDIPNVRSAAIELRSPRPVRGLREIDVSRNNLMLGRNEKVLRDSAPPKVMRSGHGRTAMILVPGVYSGRDAFDGFVSRNSSRYAFHTVTPPGLAATPPRGMPPATVSYGDLTWTRRLAADIVGLIERQRLEHPIVVTHGFPGSLAAEEIAVSHPQLIGGVVEIASMAVQPYPTSSGREATPEERVAIVDDSWARQWFRYVTPETWESNNYPADMFTNDAVRAERIRREIEAVPLPVKIRYLAEFMASDHRPAFGGIGVPVLVLRPGFNETLLSNAAFGWFKASFQDGWNGYPANPRVELMTIPDARALILDDQPGLADRAIATFVSAAAQRKREPSTP
jgi:pimeloyl-ACP methyl ester carboxylesterase